MYNLQFNKMKTCLEEIGIYLQKTCCTTDKMKVNERQICINPKDLKISIEFQAAVI